MIRHRRHSTGLAVFLLFVTISPVANGQVQQRPNKDDRWWETAGAVITRASPLPQKARFHLLRFSPDGRYILARDDSGIALLSVRPFAVLFHHSAENVSMAGFTPDSQQVWFVNTIREVTSLRFGLDDSSYVERWSVEEWTRIEKKEIPLPACKSSDLSPDSRVLACVDTRGTLRLIDVDSVQTIFEKKKFGNFFLTSQYPGWITESGDGLLGDPGWASISFTPDGRFVVVVPEYSYGRTLTWDLREKRKVKLTGGLRKLTRGFAFIGPDKVMISSDSFLSQKIVNATLADFPSGRVLLKLKVPQGRLLLAADPAFVLIGPIYRFTRDSYPVQKIAAVEIRTGQVIISDAEAMDVFGNYYVTELKDGTVGLYERGKGLQATITIDEH
jgi:WD40 repeat protein